jgi:hypothetical protein
VRIIDCVLEEAVRPSNRIVWRVKVEILLKDSLYTALVNCDLEGKASWYVHVGDEASALDAVRSMDAIAI